MAAVFEEGGEKREKEIKCRKGGKEYQSHSGIRGEGDKAIW